MIVGAGFAGLEAARRLRDRPVEVLLLDKHNYHTFTPLLYQVATAGLEQDSIVKPVRTILRGAQNVRFRMASVESLDLEARRLITDGGEIGYDYLILAAGSVINYFGSADLASASLGLKDVDDAVAIRAQVTACFERAALETDAAERARLMTVVVAGGGPTGVELAGALAELKMHVLSRDFPELDVAGAAGVVLLEAASALLPGFPDTLRESATRQLRQIGVDVRLESRVESVDERRVLIAGGETIEAATVLWVAGVVASSAVAPSSLERKANGRVGVLGTLQAPAHPEVFIAGDLAYFEQEGRPLAMMAPVAIQQGRQAAENIVRLAQGQALVEFRYRDRGVMATIGRRRAVAYVKPYRFSGLAAWVIWLTVHLFWLIGFRNKMLVMIDWAWNYFLYEQASRLLTGGRLRRAGAATTGRRRSAAPKSGV